MYVNNRWILPKVNSVLFERSRYHYRFYVFYGFLCFNRFQRDQYFNYIYRCIFKENIWEFSNICGLKMRWRIQQLLIQLYVQKAHWVLLNNKTKIFNLPKYLIIFPTFYWVSRSNTWGKASNAFKKLGMKERWHVGISYDFLQYDKFDDCSYTK